MSPAEAINQQWERIEAWLSANAPEAFSGLNPGATEEEIAAVEQVIGIALPEDMRASYLRHNGADEKTAPGLLGTAYFHNLPFVMEDRNGYLTIEDAREWRSKPDPEIRDDWWNPLWLPVGRTDSGDRQCVDLAPAEGGTFGQIIDWDRSTNEVHVLAPSFLAWLTEFADDLENGVYVVSEEYGAGIVPYWDVSEDLESDETEEE